MAAKAGKEKVGECSLNDGADRDVGSRLKPQGAMAMLGFAKRFRPTRTTEEWMAELREAELE
jgi:hypothetical protein